LSDEIYRAISYDGAASSMLEVAPRLDRLVVADGVAKSFAMTGWRIGWSIAPRALAKSMTALQSHTTSNAATLSQHAALAAVSNREEGERAIATMVTELARRRDLALALLYGSGVDVIDPSGAFYLYIRAGESTTADAAPGTTLCERLLDEYDVAVVPGAAFHSPEWIRASYAAPAEDVLEGVRRIISARIS
jgi:aspartate aminotransferase